MEWPLLNKCDTVLVHSSAMRSLLKYKTPARMVQSLLDAVGERGTVVFPVFFFSWCNGKSFDVRKQNGETGVLGNAALKMGAVRSMNPVYSFAAIGKHESEFDLDNYYMLGMGSPFNVLMRLDAKIAAIDVVDNECMTFYHHVEKCQNAQHRFEKMFSGNYTDWMGCTTWKDYSYFVRNLGVETDVAPMERKLWWDGVYQGNKPYKGDGMRVAKARDIYKATAEVLRMNGGENFLWRSK